MVKASTIAFLILLTAHFKGTKIQRLQPEQKVYNSELGVIM